MQVCGLSRRQKQPAAPAVRGAPDRVSLTNIPQQTRLAALHGGNKMKTRSEVQNYSHLTEKKLMSQTEISALSVELLFPQLVWVTEC